MYGTESTTQACLSAAQIIISNTKRRKLSDKSVVTRETPLTVYNVYNALNLHVKLRSKTLVAINFFQQLPPGTGKEQRPSSHLDVKSQECPMSSLPESYTAVKPIALKHNLVQVCNTSNHAIQLI